MTEQRQSWMHLKPWSTTYTRVCGCQLDRNVDDGVSFIPCAECRTALMKVAMKREPRGWVRQDEGRREE